MKGISPFIAEVLLIGFTIAIAAIIITWSSGFTKTSSQTIQQQSETQLLCSYAGINTYGNVKYKNGYLSGYVINTGNVPLKVNFQIIYDNGTSEDLQNIIPSLNPGTLNFFNISTNSNIQFILIYTNCTSPPVTAKIEKSEIIFE
ncbi:MAG: hypothetical protein QXI09_02750 [Candidatus Aenigmatarchaeota archaeon]